MYTDPGTVLDRQGLLSYTPAVGELCNGTPELGTEGTAGYRQPEVYNSGGAQVAGMPQSLQELMRPHLDVRQASSMQLDLAACETVLKFEDAPANLHRNVMRSLQHEARARQVPATSVVSDLLRMIRQAREIHGVARRPQDAPGGMSMTPSPTDFPRCRLHPRYSYRLQ